MGQRLVACVVLWFDSAMKILWAPFCWTCLFAAGLAGCSTVPETGRRQLNFIPPGEEIQLGLSSFEKLKQEVPVSKDSGANALVQKVGRRIAAVAPLPNARWEFVVFESQEANAFCLPGGKVGVYAGILPITRDEAGLATVLGHEIGHAVAHHGAERMSESLLLQTGGSLADAGLAKGDPRTHAAVVTAYSVVAQVGRELPHSRKQESEADHLGLIYMARAGYDPEAAVAFWERFSEFNRQRGGGAGLWFLRTHPLDEARIKQLKEWLPEARREYRPQN
jgi:predicted Zn-dependent protease